MREIVLDTETTGLDPLGGHRIIEIGCVELMHLMPTGETRQFYINPERDVPPDAEAVHGLSAAFLSDKPRFAEIADELCAFIGEDRLIAHNAGFDINFLNAEFARLGLPRIPPHRVVDTLELAKRRFPGARCSLDALCERYQIDNSSRTVHGALLDAQLLAEVYLELSGGRQPDLILAPQAARPTVEAVRPRPARRSRLLQPTAEELALHRAFLDQLREPLWLS